MIVYLSGPISGDPDYKVKFAIAELFIQKKYPNAKILNPTILPDGLMYEHYMRIDLAMVSCCEVVMVLPDWDQSKGAVAEVAYARSLPSVDVIELPEELFSNESIKRHKWQAQYEC